MKSYLKKIAAVDINSLILFRVFFGIIVFISILNKGLYNLEFYSEYGAYPRSLAIQNINSWSYSLHFLSDNLWVQNILTLIGLGLAIYFIFGAKFRLSATLLWIFITSLHNRNYLVLHSGDTLMRCMLFITIFMPLGRHQINYFLNTHKRRICSLPILISQLQILLVYTFTAILKNHSHWNKDFLAVYYTLNLDMFTTPIGNYIKNNLFLTKVLTFITYYSELYAPLLFIIPKKYSKRAWHYSL